MPPACILSPLEGDPATRPLPQTLAPRYRLPMRAQPHRPNPPLRDALSTALFASQRGELFLKVRFFRLVAAVCNSATKTKQINVLLSYGKRRNNSPFRPMKTAPAPHMQSVEPHPRTPRITRLPAMRRSFSMRIWKGRFQLGIDSRFRETGIGSRRAHADAPNRRCSRSHLPQPRPPAPNFVIPAQAGIQSLPRRRPGGGAAPVGATLVVALALS